MPVDQVFLQEVDEEVFLGAAGAQVRDSLDADVAGAEGVEEGGGLLLELREDGPADEVRAEERGGGLDCGLRVELFEVVALEFEDRGFQVVEVLRVVAELLEDLVVEFLEDGVLIEELRVAELVLEFGDVLFDIVERLQSAEFLLFDLITELVRLAGELGELQVFEFADYCQAFYLGLVILGLFLFPCFIFFVIFEVIEKGLDNLFLCSEPVADGL